MGKRKGSNQISDNADVSADENKNSDDESTSSLTSDSVEDESGSEDTSSSPDFSESSDIDRDDDGDDDFKELIVDFEFHDPQEKDYLGLKALLCSYLDGQTYHSSDFVNAILEQTAVGTVVKTADDEDPVAIMTVLNVAKFLDSQWFQEIKSVLHSKCSDPQTFSKLTQVLQKSQSTGLIVNERLINCPPSIAPPLMHYLFDELEGVVNDPDVEEDERREFSFDQYLLFSRVYADPLGAEQPEAGPSVSQPPQQGSSSSGGKRAAKKQKSSNASAPVIVYTRPEDEFLHAVASWSFTFPVENRAVARDELQPLRLVALIPASKIQEARDGLDSLLGNPAKTAKVS